MTNKRSEMRGDFGLAMLLGGVALGTEKAPVIHRISFIGLGEEMADAAKTDASDRQVTIAIHRPAD